MAKYEINENALTVLWTCIELWQADEELMAPAMVARLLSKAVVLQEEKDAGTPKPPVIGPTIHGVATRPA